MVTRRIALLAVGSLGLACLIGGLYARRQLSAKQLTQGAATEASQQPAQPWVTVDWSLALDDNTRAIYQQAATLISGFVDVPNDRANYFAPCYGNIGSWAGMVNSVQADSNGGYYVTVAVDGIIDPVQLDNDQTGAIPPAIYAHYAETYYIDNASTVTYNGFATPPGYPTHLSFSGAL